jgi:hydantoinase/carbamoylase family amidase
MKLKINLDRLRSEMLELCDFGRGEIEPGFYRMAFTEEDMAARRWLIQKIESLGGSARLDEAGNVNGRFFKIENTPSVVVGSHTDTVYAGGMFDGALGVLAGLESIRVMLEAGLNPKYPLELVSFADEEGRFGGMFGSQAFTGNIDEAWLDAAATVEGERLADAMRAKGLNHILALEAARSPDSLHAFLELHIEQGPVLESAGVPVGIVEGISGIFKWAVRLEGEANHAGTTPMHLRRDAFMGLTAFAQQIPEILQEVGTEVSRLTIGKVDIKPGYPHTVPGAAEFSLVGRDMSPDVLRSLAQACKERLNECARKCDLKLECQELSWLTPQACHEDVIVALETAAKELGVPSMRMISGAGHDTQFLAQVTRAGLLFVPSVGGISHSPEERTDWTDVEAGTNVLLHTLIALSEAN